MKLEIEVNGNAEEIQRKSDGSKFFGGMVMVTPPVGENFWLLRVKLGGKIGQSLVAFPKFNTIGIGFAIEEDWNTNLPYGVGVDRLFKHIKHNKGDRSIPNGRVKEGLALLINEVHNLRGTTQEQMDKVFPKD